MIIGVTSISKWLIRMAGYEMRGFADCCTARGLWKAKPGSYYSFMAHPSIPLLPITSELRETPLFRIRLEPNAENGLKKISQVMVDKAQSIQRENLGPTFGFLNTADMLAIDRALALFLGIT